MCDIQFDHPYGEDVRNFVRDLVTRVCGEDHVKDIDWENCDVIDD